MNKQKDYDFISSLVISILLMGIGVFIATSKNPLTVDIKHVGVFMAFGGMIVFALCFTDVPPIKGIRYIISTITKQDSSNQILRILHFLVFITGFVIVLRYGVESSLIIPFALLLTIQFILVLSRAIVNKLMISPKRFWVKFKQSHPKDYKLTLITYIAFLILLVINGVIIENQWLLGIFIGLLQIDGMLVKISEQSVNEENK